MLRVELRVCPTHSHAPGQVLGLHTHTWGAMSLLSTLPTHVLTHIMMSNVTRGTISHPPPQVG